MKKIRGDSVRAVERGANVYQIFVGSGEKYYSLDIREHELKEGFMLEHPTYVTDENRDFFIGLAEALQSMELFPRDADKAEIQATKYHLEDMRKLVFKSDSTN